MVRQWWHRLFTPVWSFGDVGMMALTIAIVGAYLVSRATAPQMDVLRMDAEVRAGTLYIDASVYVSADFDGRWVAIGRDAKTGRAICTGGAYFPYRAGYNYGQPETAAWWFEDACTTEDFRGYDIFVETTYHGPGYLSGYLPERRMAQARTNVVSVPERAT